MDGVSSIENDQLKVNCSGCNDFSIDMHKTIGSMAPSSKVFVRLSRQEPDKNSANSSQVLWHGFVDTTPLDAASGAFELCLSCDQIMTWPELTSYRAWAGSFTREPWLRAPKKYEKCMQQLFHNLRVTIISINDNDDDSLWWQREVATL